MNKKSIERLDKLKFHRKCLLNQISRCYIKNRERDNLFKELEKADNEIKKLKFKIRLERELNKNVKDSNTN